jgi:hypothetical protein
MDIIRGKFAYFEYDLQFNGRNTEVKTQNSVVATEVVMDLRIMLDRFV